MCCWTPQAPLESSRTNVFGCASAPRRYFAATFENHASMRQSWGLYTNRPASQVINVVRRPPLWVSPILEEMAVILPISRTPNNALATESRSRHMRSHSSAVTFTNRLVWRSRMLGNNGAASSTAASSDSWSVRASFWRASATAALGARRGSMAQRGFSLASSRAHSILSVSLTCARSSSAKLSIESRLHAGVIADKNIVLASSYSARCRYGSSTTLSHGSTRISPVIGCPGMWPS